MRHAIAAVVLSVLLFAGALGAQSTMEIREGGAGGNVITDDQAVGGLRDFGQVPISTQSSPLTIYITNTGGSSITFGSITKTGAQVLDFDVNASGMTNPLGPGQSTSFTITFYRSTAGTSTATVQLPHNATGAGATPFEINVQSEVITPPPTGGGGGSGSGGSDGGGDEESCSTTAGEGYAMQALILLTLIFLAVRIRKRRA